MVRVKNRVNRFLMNRNKIMVKEGKKHYDAYNYWFNLTEKGYDTSSAIELTAEHIGISTRRMWEWYSGLDWKTRAKKRRQDIQKELEKKENKTLAKNKKQYLDILHRILYDYVEAGLPAKIESIKDLETVIKNSLILQDAPTEVVKQDTTNVNYEVEATELFDKQLMAKIIEQEEGQEEKESSDSNTDGGK